MPGSCGTLSLAELDRALVELQTDVGQLQQQLTTQKAEFQQQLRECAWMGASDVLASTWRIRGNLQMRQIMQDVVLFREKLQEKAGEVGRVTAENERLRGALVLANREKEVAAESL